jgi:hypothetical protein
MDYYHAGQDGKTGSKSDDRVPVGHGIWML